MHLARSRALVTIALCVTALFGSAAQGPPHRPLRATDIEDIARLEMMEDRRLPDNRQFDSTELARIFSSTHPEVRRRAAQSIGRINDKRGIALLLAVPLDRDTAVAATVAWSIGQLRDSTTIPWLDSLLSNKRTPPQVAAEAAIALGKIKTAGARDVLARYLTDAGPVATRDTPALRQALLSIGRSTARGDISSIERWTKSRSEEVRWRATWSLLRPRDPAAVPTLLVMSKDRSPLVRSWAIRGLTKAQTDSAGVSDAAEAQLIVSASDADHRVQTEAVRALGTFTDSAATAVLVKALSSPDSWVSVSAAEGLGRIRSAATVPQLLAAGRNKRSCALRVTAMNSLRMFSPNDAIALGIELTRDTVPYCRATAAQLLTQVSGGRGAVEMSAIIHAYVDTAMTAFRSARRAEFSTKNLPIRVAAIRAIGTWGDTTDLPALTEARSKADTLSAVEITTAAAIAAIQRRASGAPAGGGRGGRPPQAPVTKTLEDYKRLVERWVVPDYNGKARPIVRFDTPRGQVIVELLPGDAPLATDDLVRTVKAGSMIGTEFTRVVPDFVDQQQTIRGGNTLRDEVNRNGLLRNTLAWATAGLDTGSPGYTLGHTPQPHNEGDFTALGKVVRGTLVMDRIELGDRIVGATMVGGR